MRRRDFIGLLGCAPLACGGRDDLAHSLGTNHVQLIPGMRQDLTTENAPAGTLYQASNVRYTKQGGITCRPGVDLIPSTTQGSTHEVQDSGPPAYLAAIGDTALFGAGDGKSYALDSSGILNFCGTFSSCLPVSRVIGLVSEINSGFGTMRYAVAANPAGYTLVASSDFGGTVYIAVQSSDGTRLTLDTALGSECSAIAVQDKLVLVVQNGTALVAYVYTITNGVISVASATVATLTGSTSYWDISTGPASDPGIWWLVYRSAAAVLTVSTMTSAPAVSAASVTTVSVTGNVICSIYFDDTNSRVWVGWWNDPGVSGNVRFRAFSSAGTALCAVTTIASATTYGPPLIGPAANASTSAFFTYNIYSATAPAVAFGTITLPANPANTATVVAGNVYGVVAMSKPDARQRSWVLTMPATSPLSTGETVIQRSLLLAWESNTMSGASVHLATDTFEQDSWSFYPQKHMFSAISNQSGACVYAMPRRLRIGVDNSAGLFGIDVFRYDSIESHAWRSTVSLGRSLVVAGQPVETFTGAYGTVVQSAGGTLPIPRHGSTEVGFPVAPQIISLAQSTASGLLTVTGVYSYVVVTEWIDMFGRRHRSPPSAPETITLTGANDTVTVTITCPDYGERWPAESSIKPVHHVYRTEAGGNVHYRVTPGAGAPGASAPGAGTRAYLDQRSDVAAVAAGDALYVDAALCDYDLAPSCRFVWRDERRVFFGGLWETDQIAWTLDAIPGQPIEFSDFEGGNGPVFRTSIGEPVTGGASQDGINFAFGRRAIYAFSGDGPDRQGNGEFSKPRAITYETGCKDYRSVRATSRGIFFQSDRGIELLPRGGGNPIFIGAAIQDLTNEYPLVLGTALHSDTLGRQIRFLLSYEDQTASIVACYHLDLGHWSYDNYTAALQCIGDWPNGTAMAFLDQAEPYLGQIEEKDSDSYTDPAASVTARVVTSVMRPWGPVGFGRANSASILLSKTNANDHLYFLAGLDSTAKFKEWDLSSSTGASYRELTCAMECTGIYFDAQITRASATQNPNFHGITLELQQLEGSRRKTAGEQ